MESINLVSSLVSNLNNQIDSEVYGQDEAKDLIIGAFIIGGHVLLEGPPGVAKTLLARSFASSIGMNFNRIQFTPDLMPSDIIGVNVYDQKVSAFQFIKGPIFSDILLADEINRTPPKTQAALLEAMQEKNVTVDGQRMPLGEFFFVLATQNPIEQEGTYPLPEAQLDRFLFKINITYPGKEFEVDLISKLAQKMPDQQGGDALKSATGKVDLRTLQAAKRAVYAVRLESAIADYIFRISEASRQHSEVELGLSPRASVNLALGSKLIAALDNRDYVIPDDVKKIAPFVIKHRLLFKPEVLDPKEAEVRVFSEILKKVPVPQRV